MASSAARPARIPSSLAPEPLERPPDNPPPQSVDNSGPDFLGFFLRPALQGRSFLKLLRSEAQVVYEAATALSRCAGDAPRDALAQFLPAKSCLRDLGRDLDAGLRESLIVPLAHEDTRSISAVLNGVLEGIMAVAALPAALKVMAEARLCEASGCCARSIVSAVATLPRGKEMGACTAELAACARRAEFLLRDFELEHATSERDAIRLLRNRDAIVAIRALFRRYREIAYTLEHAVLRNG